MKKSYIVIGIVLLLVLMGGCGSYNGMNTARVNVDEKWANVQSSYQRRADLIPNLVSTVQGEAEFERGTLNDVINARAKATAVTVDPSKVTPEQLALRFG